MVRVLLGLLAAMAAALAAGAGPVLPGAAVIPIVSASRTPARPPVSPSRAVRIASMDTGGTRPDSSTVNRYLSYDSSAKSVALTLVAAANSAQGGFNFNGGSVGNQTIIVPLGWEIDIDFQNHDVVPHSALVIAAQNPLPAMPDKPSFPRAYTTHLIDGLPAQTGHDSMRFTAGRAGDYLIACGVPGHALSGMFIRFVVSAEATTPSDTGTIATP